MLPEAMPRARQNSRTSGASRAIGRVKWALIGRHAGPGCTAKELDTSTEEELDTSAQEKLLEGATTFAQEEYNNSTEEKKLDTFLSAATSYHRRHAPG